MSNAQRGILTILVLLTCWLVIQGSLEVKLGIREQKEEAQATAFERGYLMGSSDAFKLLCEPYVMRDYQLNGIQANKFADMMNWNRKISEEEECQKKNSKKK